jgi:hypothetical protein
MFIAPVCSACGGVITDFSDANAVVIGTDDSDGGEFLGRIASDATLTRLPGHVVIVHKRCDTTECTPWTPLDNLMFADQRYEFEKPLPERGKRRAKPQRKSLRRKRSAA